MIGSLASTLPSTVVISTDSEGAKADPVHGFRRRRRGNSRHQRLDLWTADELIGQLGESDAPRHQRGRHGELHAEFRLERGLRLFVAQHQHLHFSGGDADAVDIWRLEIMASGEVDRGIDRAMGGIADRIALEVQALAHEVPLLRFPHPTPGQIGSAIGREGCEEAGLVLQRIGRGGESGLRQACRDHARIGRRGRPGSISSGIQNWRRARPPSSPRSPARSPFPGLEPAQFGAGGRGRDGAAYRRRVPALLMQRNRLAHQQLCPNLVAGGVGGQHVRAAGSQCFALREDGGTRTALGWPSRVTSS